MSIKPRIGIAGGGAIANSHVEGLRQAGCEVVACADPAETARTKMAEKYQLKTYATLAEMLKAEKLDAISVCAPNAFHGPLAVEALKAGVHVLCEKPPATSLAAAVEMRDAARASGKTLMMGFNQRFDSNAQQADRLRQNGTLGEVYHARTVWIRRRGIPGLGGWFTTKKMAGGGPIYDIGIHLLDRAWFAIGRPTPTAVSAVAYKKFMDIDKYVCEGMWAGPRRPGGTADVEDYAVALIRFAGGVSMQLEVSWAVNRADEPPCTYVMGDKAGLSWQGGDQALTLYGEADNAIATTELIFDRTIYDNRFQHFAKVLRGEAKCSCTGDDGVAIQAILDAIYESAEKNAEVKISIPK